MAFLERVQTRARASAARCSIFPEVLEKYSGVQFGEAVWFKAGAQVGAGAAPAGAGLWLAWFV